jgi:hypothetical protein
LIRTIISEEKAEFQWLQDPSEISGDNLKNVRCEASRHFRIKKTKLMGLQQTVRTRTSETCIME